MIYGYKLTMNKNGLLNTEAVSIENPVSLIVGSRLYAETDMEITLYENTVAARRLDISDGVQIDDQLFIIREKIHEPEAHTIRFTGVEMFSYLLMNRVALMDMTYDKNDESGSSLVKRVLEYNIMAKRQRSIGEPAIQRGFTNLMVLNITCAPLDIAPIKEGDALGEWLFDALEDQGMGIYARSYIDHTFSKFQLTVNIMPSGKISLRTMKPLSMPTLNASSKDVESFSITYSSNRKNPGMAVTYNPIRIQGTTGEGTEEKVHLEQQEASYQASSYIIPSVPWNRREDDVMDISGSIFYNSKLDRNPFENANTDGTINLVPSEYAKEFLKKVLRIQDTSKVKLTIGTEKAGLVYAMYVEAARQEDIMIPVATDIGTRVIKVDPLSHNAESLKIGPNMNVGGKTLYTVIPYDRFPLFYAMKDTLDAFYTSTPNRDALFAKIKRYDKVIRIERENIVNAEALINQAIVDYENGVIAQGGFELQWDNYSKAMDKANTNIADAEKNISEAQSTLQKKETKDGPEYPLLVYLSPCAQVSLAEAYLTARAKTEKPYRIDATVSNRFADDLEIGQRIAFVSDKIKDVQIITEKTVTIEDGEKTIDLTMVQEKD